MQNEITRLWTRWMQHPQHGVNAQLAFVPRNRFAADGSLLEDAAPDPVAIYNDVDNPELALALDPPSTPAVLVFTDSDADVNVLDAHYLKTGESVIVAFAYVTRDVAKEQAVQDGGYVLRAIRRSVWRMNKQSLSNGYRELNGIRILSVGRTTTQRMGGGVGQSELQGFVLASVSAVDTAP
jgi:hypothetical protein